MAKPHGNGHKVAVATAPKLKNAGNSTRRGVAGNGGARAHAGRKSKAAMMGLLALLDECWDEDSRKQCVRMLAGKAAQGDIEATKLLMNYTFGRPKEHQEHGGVIRIELEYVDRPMDERVA